MITKIIPGDVFSTKLQAGESPNKPIDIIAGTNQVWLNTRGVAHEIWERFNLSFQNLLQGHKEKEVQLGYVFSWEGMIEAQRANFHAIAVNRREYIGGPQDWSQLLESLTTWLEYLHLNQNTYEDTDITDDPNYIDMDLRDEIAGLEIREWVDYASQVESLAKAHIEKTRRKFRVVLIGGSDGVKNQANLQDTLEALESSWLILHLYLGHAPSVVRAIKKVIPSISALKDRELLVGAE
jgi:hypothetical protein